MSSPDLRDRLRAALSEAIAGAGGIIMSAYIVFPIDFVKTRLQLPGSGYTSMTDGFKRIISEEGFFTLYQGVESELLKGSLQNFLYFFSYDLMKQFAIQEKSLIEVKPIQLKTSHSRPLLNKTLHCYCHGSNTSGVRYAFRKEKKSRTRSRAGSLGNGILSGDNKDTTALLTTSDSDDEGNIMDERETRQIVKVSSHSPITNSSTIKNETLTTSNDPQSSPAATPIKSQPPPQLSIISNLLIGIVAGCFCQLFINPLSVIQTRIMTSAKKSAVGGKLPRVNTSIIGTFLEIWRNEGFAAFYTGLVPAFILTTNPAIQFLVFDRLKSMLQTILRQHMNDRPLSALESFVIGAIAKITATLATYPYIMAKLRLQYKSPTGAVSAQPQYSGTFDVILSILKNDGVMGLYAGLRAQLLKSVLGAALMFMMKEKIVEIANKFMKKQPKNISMGETDEDGKPNSKVKEV